MSDVTQILSAIEDGDAQAAERVIRKKMRTRVRSALNGMEPHDRDVLVLLVSGADPRGQLIGC